MTWLSFAGITSPSPKSVPFRLGLGETAAPYLIFPLVSGGFAPAFPNGGISLRSHPSTPIPAVRKDSGIASLPLTETDALAAKKLQLFHKDPFDHMLIAQALMGGLAVVTPDRAF